MQTAQQFKDEGNVAFKAGDFPKAIELYTQAIEADPTNPTYFSNRSAVHFNMNNFEGALEDANKCVEVDPNFQKGYVRKVNALSKLSQPEDAKSTLEEALTKFPENAQLKQLKTSLEKPAFNMQEMLQNPMIQNMMKENPQLVQQIMSNPALLQNPQMMQMLMGMFQQKQAQQGGQDAPTPPPQGNQGNAQFTNSQFTGNTAPTQTPPTPQQCPVQTPTPAETREAEKKVENIEFEKVKKEAGQLYMKKQFAEAVALYDKCSELNKCNLVVRNNKAACLIELKKYEEALKVLDEAVLVYQDTEFENRSFENYAKVLARQGRVHHIQQNWEKSIDCYENSLMENNVKKVSATLRQVKRDRTKSVQEAYVDPVKSEEHRQKGNEFYKAQRYPQALKEYEEAQKRNPADSKVIGNLSAVFIKLMNFNEAMKYCEKVLEMDPTNVKAQNRKGQIYNFRKEYHKAMDTYKLVLSTHPNDPTALQGINTTQQKIAMGMSNQTDEERVKRAMQDPEIARIMQDPMVRIALNRMQTDPSSARECMQDPSLAPKIQKLIQAGILRTG